jgi:hypothetical protein
MGFSRRFPPSRSGNSSPDSVILNASPTAWYDPTQTQTVTTVDGLVSQITDATGNGNTASQGTAANRPLLSGASMLENRVKSSEAEVTDWVLEKATFTGNTITSPNGYVMRELKEDNTAGEHRVYQTTFVTAVSGLACKYGCLVKRGVGTRDLRVFALGAFGTVPAVIFNLTTGAIRSESGGASGYIEDLGDGIFFVKVLASTNSTSAPVLYFQLTNGATTSYTGDDTSSLYIGERKLQVATASDTYTPTTTSPIIAGLQGNRGMVFDGSNDSLGTSLAVNPTGGMWGVAVVRGNTSPSGQLIFANPTADATRRILAYPTSVQIMNGNTVYIGRTAPVGSFSANETAVFSFTYDGGTSASGIKLYKNGVQIDTADNNAGVYTVPTAGQNLSIGRNNADTINGVLYEAIFAQGSTITDGNRSLIEQSLITQYIPNYIYFDPASNVTAISSAVASWTDTTNTYVASQSTAASRPAVSTLNGQAAFLYDGSADNLASNIAVNPTGGMCGIVVVRPNVVTTQRLLAVWSSSAGARLFFTIDTNGAVICIVANGNTAYIGRLAPTSSVVANETTVLSFTYDGTTNATGVKIYKNGVQIDNTSTTVGSYTVPTAGNNLRIGADETGNFLNGLLADAIFIQGRVVSASERQNWEQRLMSKFGIA